MTFDMAAVAVVLEGLAELPVKRAGHLYFQILEAANKHVADANAAPESNSSASVSHEAP